MDIKIYDAFAVAVFGSHNTQYIVWFYNDGTIRKVEVNKF